MTKRMQFYLDEDSKRILDEYFKAANEDFKTGSINYSDIVNEMIATSKIDIKTLQLKKTDVRRSLLLLAANSKLGLDDIIKRLQELKAKTAKRSVKGVQKPSEVPL